MEPALLTIKEFVLASGLRERTVRNLLTDGHLRRVMIGRKYFIPREEIDGFIRRELQPRPTADGPLNTH